MEMPASSYISVLTVPGWMEKTLRLGYSAKRTFFNGTNNTGVSNENVQMTEAGDVGRGHLFCPFHTAHVGGEGEDLCRGELAKDRIFACIEGGLRASH